MRIGIGLPQAGRLGTRNNIIHFAREAERAGYDSLWVSERLLYPIEPKQPYGPLPSWPEIFTRVLDPIDTLAFVAAATETIRLGTSVLDLPLHTPAHLAKRIATLDVLSNGRAVIGAGIGWSEDEYAASNVPFAKRGQRMHEFIQALQALWGPDPVAFQGDFYTIPASIFNPKPMQRPLLVLGGYAPNAVARAAHLADGFNPMVMPDAATNEQWLGVLRQAWRDAGRAGNPQIIMIVNHAYVSESPLAKEREFLTGSVEQVYADLGQLAAWGATEVFFDLSARYALLPDGYEQMLEQLTRLSEILIPIRELRH